MPKSVFEAITMGIWDFEPETIGSEQYDRTDAMPGSQEKVEIMAARLRGGLPLWHPSDRDDMDSPPRAEIGTHT